MPAASLKELSFRSVILYGGTSAPSGGLGICRGRRGNTLAFRNVKDLPSPKLSFKLEDSPARGRMNFAAYSDFQTTCYTYFTVNTY